ncbi:hypothetical protein ABQE44_25810, partial [Mycolicibacterium sp. XJ2546]
GPNTGAPTNDTETGGAKSDTAAPLDNAQASGTKPQDTAPADDTDTGDATPDTPAPFNGKHTGSTQTHTESANDNHIAEGEPGAAASGRGADEPGGPAPPENRAA